MRITNRMLNNNYMANLNSSLEDLNNLNQKVATGRSYLTAAENPAAAIKAFRVRQNLTRIALYQDNVSAAGSIMTDVEAAYKELNDVLTDVAEQISQGRSDIYNADDRQIIAQVLRNYQEEVVEIFNSKSAGKYVFGGSDMVTAPFTLHSGVLAYHGTDVNSNAGFSHESGVSYDVGLGIKVDAAGRVVPGTAFAVSLSGSAAFGTGTDGNGVPNNIYHLLGAIAQQFESNHPTNLDGYLDKLASVGEKVMVDYANVGQKTNFLEFLTERLATNKLNATTRQSALESIDPAQGIMDYHMQEAAYQAALAMGSKLIQPSLLDYMN